MPSKDDINIDELELCTPDELCAILSNHVLKNPKFQDPERNDNYAKTLLELGANVLFSPGILGDLIAVGYNSSALLIIRNKPIFDRIKNVNVRHFDSILHLAVVHNHVDNVDIIQAMIDNGIDTTYHKAGNIEVPLSLAILYNNKPAIDILLPFAYQLRDNPDIVNTILSRCVESNNLEILRLLVDEFKFKVNNYLGSKSRYSPHPLATAVNSSKISIDMVKFLLKRNAKIKLAEMYPAPGTYNNRSIIYQLLTGFEKYENSDSDTIIRIIDMLIKHGADVNRHYNDQRPVLCISSTFSYDITKHLLDRGANIHANKDGINPLMQMLMSKRNNMSKATIPIKYDFDMIELLLNRGVDVNALSKDGVWMLEALFGINCSGPHSISTDSAKIAKMLFDYGLNANQEAKPSYGYFGRRELPSKLESIIAFLQKRRNKSSDSDEVNSIDEILGVLNEHIG